MGVKISCIFVLTFIPLGWVLKFCVKSVTIMQTENDKIMK